jgi:ABC-type multidrug transport system ATPase subunit
LTNPLPTRIPAAEEVKLMLHNLRLCGNVTVLHTRHNLAQVEELCDRAIRLYRGRVIPDSDLSFHHPERDVVDHAVRSEILGQMSDLKNQRDKL